MYFNLCILFKLNFSFLDNCRCMGIIYKKYYRNILLPFILLPLSSNIIVQCRSQGADTDPVCITAGPSYAFHSHMDLALLSPLVATRLFSISIILFLQDYDISVITQCVHIPRTDVPQSVFPLTHGRPAVCFHFSAIRNKTDISIWLQTSV